MAKTEDSSSTDSKGSGTGRLSRAIGQWTGLFFLILIGTPEPSAAAGSGEQVVLRSTLSRHLAYLQRIEAAGEFLDRGEPSQAVVELAKALDLRVPNSYLRQFPLRGSGATAHYLMACAHSKMGRTEEALREIRAAVANGFSDLERMLGEPCLNSAMDESTLGWLAESAARAARQDPYSGKTVVNESFAMGMVLHRRNNFPKLGELAPEIALERSDESGPWALSLLRNRQPVVLVFGSFT